MKTLMTAVLVLALASTGIGLSQEKIPLETEKNEPQRNPAKRVTIQDVKMMLETMGYEPKPFTDKEGKLIGYSIKFESDDFTLYCNFAVSPNGENLWLSGSFGKGADESVPVASVLKLLELNDSIWPAYITYLPKIKSFYVEVPAQTAHLTPAGLRSVLNTYTKAIKSCVQAWEKSVAEAKTKAKEPNPLP